MHSFDFSQALLFMKQGMLVCRESWKGLKFIMLWDPKEVEVKVQQLKKRWFLGPNIVMKTADDKMIPYVASQRDLLSEDWHIFQSR